MRSRRMAAAVTTLAVVASGLVSAAVIGVGPVLADHCDPAEATQSPQASQTQQPDQDQNQDQGQQQDQGQNQDQGQQQDQDQGQQQDQNQQGQQQDQQGDQQGTGQAEDEQQAPQGGGIALLDPAQPPETGAPEDPEAGNPEAEPEQTAETFGRRRGGGNQPTRTPTPSPSQTQNPDDGGSTAEPSPTGSASPSPTGTGGAEEECADLGPFPEDFVDIRQVAPVNNDARAGRNGSRGTFVSQCGTNRNGHNNPDNFIVAPGVSNGAHHLHDYVGNLSTDAFSTDESLAAAGTTCRLGDKSTYFWPVLRDRRSDANATDPDGNVGQVLRPRAVTLQFRGNAASRVVAMPRFIRIITGDAKAATNGGANAKAGWSCSGFQNRISPDKYTLCPRGSQVLRILDFPSCWDGQNTDSANHRTHVVFPDQGGACPQGTRAIPQLRMTLAYNVPQGPSYAVDAFPEQKHNPVTDHGDFANVMPDRLMQFVVSCINRGRRC
ncbi:DUF1996 domain-containing protein [Nonomuraea sp. GTA35]|uniref:DUF1996 domain-containing protein n=1 Tax=Nonomuraea sp. GTA35 TaxID=1676746 RepID=UPI0035C1E2D4